MSGEQEFHQKKVAGSLHYAGSDPGEDRCDWEAEYNRLRRLFYESWELPGMKQIANAISAVAFRGADPATVLHAVTEQGAAAVSERNIRAVAWCCYPS